MPDQAYTLPEDWEKLEMEKEIQNEKNRIAMEEFLRRFPDYEGNAWVQEDAWELFHFEYWVYGIARVKRLSDNQWGWLYHIDDSLPVRVYYNFRPVDLA